MSDATTSRRDSAHPAALSRLYTVKETADYARVSTKTVRRWLDDHRIPCHRLGRLIRIAESDLVAFLRQNRSA